ncbi:hypothetical protein Z948_225 [Sulfitobacter donghicola DSW-25 = KCTC 12864 = JCM 14565]|nr:hypothetical protein Z948_225 [Sulfitobacter donghicola DSW-25 = KCTC 12864 = JCM 14565]
MHRDHIAQTQRAMALTLKNRIRAKPMTPVASVRYDISKKEKWRG